MFLKIVVFVSATAHVCKVTGCFSSSLLPWMKALTACHWLADTDLLPLSKLDLCVLYKVFFVFFLNIVVFKIDLIMTNLMYVIVYAF